jgi:hypothetical protein
MKLEPGTLIDQADLPLTREQTHDRAIFDAIKDWTVKAEAANSQEPPDLKPLLDALDEGPPRCFWHDGQTEDHRKRPVIAFGTGKKTSVNSSRRYVLPLHFAMMSALELIPYVSLTKKNKQPERKKDDQIHVFNLTVNREKKKNKHKTFSTTSIFRILFNAPMDASIRERRGKDFHFVIPDNFILERYRSQTSRDNTTQRNVLDAAKKLVGDPPFHSPWRHPFNADEMIAVLRSLFMIGDEWYWGDLLDRLPLDHSTPDFSYGRTERMVHWRPNA